MPRKTLAVLLCLLLNLPGLSFPLLAEEAASPPADLAAPARETLQRLDAPLQALHKGQYRKGDHEALAQALLELPKRLDALSQAFPENDGHAAVFARVGEALASAAAAESQFWGSLPPPQREGKDKIGEEAAGAVAAKLEAAAKAAGALLKTAESIARSTGSNGPAQAPATTPQEEEKRRDKLRRAGNAAARAASATGDEAAQRRFYENNDASGDVEGPAGKAQPPGPGTRPAPAGGKPLDGKGLVSRPTPAPEQPASQGGGRSPWSLRFNEALLAAGARAPFIGDAFNPQLFKTKRERGLYEASADGSDWLKARQGELQKQYAKDLEARAAALAARGMTPEAARQAAAKELQRRDPSRLLADYQNAMSLPSDERRDALVGLHRRLESVMDHSATGQAEAELSKKLAGLKAQADGLGAELEKALAKEGFYPRLKDLMSQDPASLSTAEKAELDRLQEKVRQTAAYRRYEKDSDALKLQMLDAARELSVLQQEDADYFKARGLWGQYVQHNLDSLGQFKDGTRFEPEELGLTRSQIPSGVVTKASHGGVAGYKFVDAQGLTRFQSPDGSLVLQEMKVDGKSIFVENRAENGRLVTATYDADMKRQSRVVYNPGKDGLFESYDEDHPWPKSKGRFVGGQFVAQSVVNEDGSRMDAAGKEAPGVWVSKDKSGAVTGWTMSDAAFSGIKDPAERAKRVEQLAAWVVGRRAGAPGELSGYAKYQADSIAALLNDQFRLVRPGTRSQILFDQEGKVVINKINELGGVNQMVGKFEDTGTGWGVGDGLPAKGLTIYVRQARSLDDQNAQFTRIFQYLGGWGRESFTTKSGTNVDSWTSWVTGPKSWETPVITRVYRQTDAQGNVAWQDKGEKVEKDHVVTYEGKGVFGATGDAVATLGKGAVDLTGSAVALGLASSPVYTYGVAALTGGSEKDVRDDLLDRAKVNFFNNAISTQLGEDYGGESYREGKRMLNLDTSKYIQNVGREMSDAGHPVLGAVLQGGVGFANNTVPLLLNIQGLNIVGKLGNAGKIVSVGVGLYMSAQGGYHFGSAVNDFGTSLSNFNESDPASKARYYASIQNLTEQSLSLPMLFGGLKDVYAKRFGGASAPETGGALTELANAKVPIRDPELTLKAPEWLESLGSKAASLDAKIPNFLQTGVTGKMGGKWLAGELAMPPVAEPKIEVKVKAASPKMEQNQAAMERALREQFELGAEEFGKGKPGPESFVDKLQKTEALPELAPENAPSEIKAQAKAAREAAVAKMAQDYLGLKEPVKVIAPDTDPLSGAQIYILKNAGGDVVGVYKVFVNNGKGPLTVMNELGAGREFGAMNLKRSEPVKPLGAFRLGDTGEIGYMMDGAPGKDFYGVFKGMGKLEPGTARAAQLPKIENDVETMAKAMAEMHQASREGTVSPEAKSESVSKALKSLEGMKAKLPPDVYAQMEARFKKLSSDFMASDVPGRITHGDAHPGNFFIKDGKVTMIDLETAMEAVGSGGEGINSPVADAARFVESIRLNNKAKGLNLSEGEMTAIEGKFLDTYAKEMSLSPEAFRAHLDYYRARMQITALKYAKDPASFNQLLDAVKTDPALQSPPHLNEGPLIPKSVGAAARIQLTSRIKENSFAVRHAENLGEQAQRDVDSLIDQFTKENPNPGIGTRALGDGFFELRGRNGGRVIIKQVSAGSYDIVGKFQGHTRGDTANSALIQRLISDYNSLPQTEQ